MIPVFQREDAAKRQEEGEHTECGRMISDEESLHEVINETPVLNEQVGEGISLHILRDTGEINISKFDNDKKIND